MRSIFAQYMITLFLILNINVALANSLIPTSPIYLVNSVVKPNEAINKLSCVELDNAIRILHPYLYTHKENFYHDDANKVAAVLAITDSMPLMKGVLGFVYMGYSSAVEEKEQRRMLNVRSQVAMFQQLKAEKHCFE